MSFLLVDRITQFESGKTVQGFKTILDSELYLTASPHSNKLVFIPSLIGEATGQLAAWAVMHALDFKKRPVAGIVSKVTILGEVYPGDRLSLSATIDNLDSEAVAYHGAAFVGDRKVFDIESAIGPMIAMDEMISEKLVRSQFESIVKLADKVPLTMLREKEAVPPSSFQNPLVTFDRVLVMDKRSECIAEKVVCPSAPYFPDHFPLKPVLPLTILLSCKINWVYQYLSQYFPDEHYQVSSVQKIKMSQFVSPGDVLQSRMKVKEKEDQLLFQFKSFVKDKRVCVCEVVIVKG